MATIRTAIQITDGMSPAFRSMSNAMGMVLNSFEAVQRASSKAIDTTSIQAAREELAKAEVNFNRMEQEIRAADQQQQKFNRDLNGGTGAADGLLSKLKGYAATLGVAFGVKEIANLSDSMVSMKSRLDLMNDGLQTTDQLNTMIFQSAQRARSSYLDTGAAVGKLGILAGNAFKNDKEMVRFAELMNKQFKIGGSSLQEQTSAMYQLTQSMAAGKLQGDEFRSIMENAPMLAQAISKYMGKSQGELKKLGAEGAITSDIIKNAMFQCADATEEKFRKLPMTWEQLWTTVTNNIIYRMQPLLDFINLIANNWGIIEPLILGAAGAAAVFAIFAYGATGATWAWVKAQAALDAVMALNPIGLVIMAIVILISLFYAGVAAVNKFTGSTYSATGMIAGAFMVAVAFIGNLLIGLANIGISIFASLFNFIAAGAEFFANVFNNPVASIIRLFAGMADSILQILQGIASAIDTVFGSNLADAVGGWRNSLQSKVTANFGDSPVKIPRLDPSSIKIDRFDYGAAYQKGNAWGTNLADRLGGKMDDLLGTTGQTAANTGAIKDKMDATDEDLKYLRDLAEQEVINRYTLTDLKVEMNNVNNINSEMDLDGVVSYLGNALQETIGTVAEGV